MICRLTNWNKTILPGPLPYTATLVTSPVLALLGLRQVQLFLGSIGRHPSSENIAVLSRLRRGSGRLVLDDIVQLRRLDARRNCGGTTSCDPVAEFGPLGVVAGRSIWVSEGEDVGCSNGNAEHGRALDEGDGWGGLEVVGLQCIAEICHI